MPLSDVEKMVTEREKYQKSKGITAVQIRKKAFMTLLWLKLIILTL